ncbi:MAG: hypothetical protein CML47_07035 [Rhodobacteraceae bacterium]|nr:MAG: hypothetical protein CML47_07035 [Paracoccaceae bacterium]|tara:strand:- start:1002 stop:2276 length:1275 start_codon:yes stop_codon:yes gene_type:complete
MKTVILKSGASFSPAQKKIKYKSLISIMVTLDNIHQKKIGELKNIDVHECKTELDNLVNQRKQILDSHIKSDSTKLMQINEKIDILQKKIDGASNQKFLRDYYLDTGEILFKYYDSIENISTRPRKNSNLSDEKQSGILSYLNTDSEAEPTTSSETETESRETRQTERQDYFSGPTSREDLRHEYLDKIENKDRGKKTKKQTIKFKCVPNNCENCKIELSHIHSEGIVECKNCGLLQTILNDTDRASYKDPPKESCYYSYRRSNHFNEWIAQFQGKETTQIPKTVLVQVVTEIKKERIRNLNELTTQKVRAILKKLKLNKYYEHIPHIINQLNGQPPPYMSRSTEELLRIMFQKIQGPFLEFCPKKRKNFLSYSYVLHKFVELLDLPHLKPLFPLLKSREKLHSQDMIWQKICERVGWTFHKSM